MDQHRQLNELTNYDTWFIMMAVKISYDKSLQCSFCVSKCAESYRINKRGCHGLSSPRPLEGFLYSKCLGNFYNFGYAQLIELYNRYKNGTLFNSGGLSDQPAKYLAAMTLIGNLVNEEELKIAESIKNKTKAKSHGRK